MTKWTDGPEHQRIGDIMVKNAPFLKMYTEYVKNFDTAMTTINNFYAKNSKFAAIVDEIHVSLCNYHLHFSLIMKYFFWIDIFFLMKYFAEHVRVWESDSSTPHVDTHSEDSKIRDASQRLLSETSRKFSRPAGLWE